MITEVEHLLEAYRLWLKDKTVLREIGEWVEITTPYLDRHNDCLQIYARRSNGGFVLTDDGFTIDDLERSGCKLETTKRQELLRVTLNGFGVQLRGGALEVHAAPENFAPRKHNLVQAMLAVNDLFYLAQPFVASLFYEDVVTWLDSSDVRYTPRVKFAGRTGFDHLFDFVIPKSRAHPERIVKAVSHPSRDTAQAVVLSWVDTKDVRPPEAVAYALLNDSEQPVPAAVLDALGSYEVVAVPWSQRERVREELAA